VGYELPACKADRQPERGLGFRKPTLMRKRHPKIAVGIGVLGIEANRLAESGFRVGVLAFADQTTASLLLTLGIWERLACCGWEGGGVGLCASGELGLEILAPCFLGERGEQGEEGSFV
jgi:hypothetical protein